MSPEARIPTRRITAIQSPIVTEVARWVKAKPGALSMGQGVVSYSPPANLYAGLIQSMQAPNRHLYSAVDGLHELKHVIADKLGADNDIEMTDEQAIVVTAGANMGFLNAILAICDNDDEVILISPCYFNHEMAINMIGCHAKLVASDKNYQPVLSSIEKAISKQTRAIVTVSPNNPAGVIYSKESLLGINRLCREYGLYHIADEAYEYFTFDDYQHYSPAANAAAVDHTISLYSLSKTYGMASWRIAYMLIPKHLHADVVKVQDTNLICPPVISQLAAKTMLSEYRDYYAPQLKMIKSNRQICIEALRALEIDHHMAPSHGAFYLYLDFPHSVSSMTLVRRLIDEFGIAGIPGSTFGHSNHCSIRISYGAFDTRTTTEAVSRLVAGLNSILG